MTAQILYYIILIILVLQFLWDWYLDALNAKHFNDPIPKALEGVFDETEYLKSQEYKKESYRFSQWHEGFNLALMLLFLILGGFAFLDEFVRKLSDNSIVISMLFIGVLAVGGSIIQIPFTYYDTFKIEEKFGFNKSTKKLFWMDQVKSILMTIVIGGIILWLILWFYNKVGGNFWWYTWILITVFTLFMTLFYSNIIVPLFNKQTPLAAGDLKNAINDFAQKARFKIDNIFIIDGSKRSTKANAYFTGFGPKKRIVLYDTLVNDLSNEEIVAVLAHEIGHYKKKHVLYNMILNILLTGFTLFILGYFVNNPLLSNALGVKTPSFHIGIIAFGILYAPITETTGLFMNMLSRKFEYQADHYAKVNFSAAPLVSSLKKLSNKSLSNLTPHPLYVFWHYSHPTLLQRIQKLNS